MHVEKNWSLLEWVLGAKSPKIAGYPLDRLPFPVMYGTYPAQTLSAGSITTESIFLQGKG